MVAVAQLALYGSFKYLELATVAVIAYSGPLFITMLAIPWLGERVGIWRWGAVLGGFAGVVLVIGPGTQVFAWAGILPAVAAFFYANSLVLTRRFNKGASHAAINLYAQAGAIVGSLILLLTTSRRRPARRVRGGSLARSGFRAATGRLRRFWGLFTHARLQAHAGVAARAIRIFWRALGAGDRVDRVRQVAGATYFPWGRVHRRRRDRDHSSRAKSFRPPGVSMAH